ncbi:MULTISPECIES: hypothetical protein [Nitrosopumilus]|uniref:hypothetical protein n=1 Tax=Nitrosopumilus TaxID=338191 RepID=UPI000A5177AF|nr:MULTISPECIES: hypothetical protein [Nitrosopumilus]
MLPELIPSVSRHFLYSILEDNHKSGMAIIETMAEARPEEIGEFLSSLANCLVSYFYQLETGFSDYEKIRIQALKALKNPDYEDNVEECN